MASLKITDVNKAGRLLKKLADKADLNGDKAIRESDIAKLARHSEQHDEFTPVVQTIDALRRSARSKGGPSLENIHKTIDQAVERLAARDRDGSKTLSDVEQGRRMTGAEAQLLRFAKEAKNKKVSDYEFPPKHEWRPGRFVYRGTPADVCQSLLDAFSKPANDNFWPGWAAGDDRPRASRYVIDGTEARSMVRALKKLNPNRQEAIMLELDGRTRAPVYGCASPTNAGKRVLEAYARELGLDLDLGQPGAPRVPNS
ncbi:LOB domain containing-protein [Myxococcota bacterium]|nr:LOB domain containing-protein [Myxococcota bacterium]